MGSLPLVGTQFSGEFSPVERSLLRFTMHLTGTATEFDSLNEIATIEVRMTLLDLLVPNLPDVNPRYPLPSVSYGHWSAHVSGFRDFEARCCEGSVNGITLGLWYRDYYHPLPTDVFSIMYADTSFGPSKYTPNVPTPEPVTLLLLGSGLVGAAWTRRRRQH